MNKFKNEMKYELSRTDCRNGLKLILNNWNRRIGYRERIFLIFFLTLRFSGLFFQLAKNKRKIFENGIARIWARREVKLVNIFRSNI